MKSIEIPSAKWRAFCDEFTGLHHGDLLTVEWLPSNGPRAEIARDMPLEEIKFDASDACLDTVVICLAQDGKRSIQHSVVDPFHLIVRPLPDGKKVLELDAENGTTLVTFHSGTLAEAVAAAEAPGKYRSAQKGGRYI